MANTPAPPQVRRLCQNDVTQAAALGAEAFGDRGADAPDPTSLPFPLPGRHQWGAFDGERLVATMTEREFGSWWGGRIVPTCGIASVAVAAEHRGRGLVRAMFEPVLADAAARGQVVASLFATAPGIYRGAGFELVTDLVWVELLTQDLLAVRPPGPATRTRRATLDDVPAIRSVRELWAGAQSGPLVRRGPSFTLTDAELLRAVSGITLAVQDGPKGEEVVTGFTSWRRGRGYDTEACLEVDDLVAFSPDAARALWRVLGSFESVAPRLHLRTSGDDLTRLALPSERWHVVARHPYLLRLLDVPAALATLPDPVDGAAPGEVSFAVEGDAVGSTDGGYRVRRGPDGTATERVADGNLPTFTPGGLALLWSGTQTATNLRWAGHLRGPSDHDTALDALAHRGARHARDYF